MTEYIAHITDDGRQQSVKAHLIEVRELCQQFGAKLNLSHVAGLAGWLHDVGKYSVAFQDYIRASAAGWRVDRGAVNHAFGGARLLAASLPATTDAAVYLQELIENVVMSHHNSAGPYDFYRPADGHADFEEKMTIPIKDWSVEELQQAFFQDFERAAFDTYVQQAVAEIAQIPGGALQKWQFYYQRFVASCLIDADHLLTANFFAQSTIPEQKISLAELAARFERQNHRLSQHGLQVKDDAQRALNELRTQMSDEAYAAAATQGNLFSLSVPTGGGKTFASLRFALRQAVDRRRDCIVYIVPFTTVIEQNAAAIRHQLQLAVDDPTLIEYHANVVDEKANAPAFYYARDTWDAPVLLTTQVAYLNALYGQGSKNLRHMHRLMNSELIFDEIQSMPIKSVGLNNQAIEWLTQAGSSTAMLCTATQPALQASVIPAGLTTEPHEIVGDLAAADAAFRRVKLTVHLKRPWQLADLISACQQELASSPSVLVILNTKQAVRNAYDAFPAAGVIKFHLSTAMCAAHRQVTFAAIKAALAAKKKVIVFATKLIEAGVDLSFGSVFRSLAGMDSVVQAAGRCNRNHERPVGQVYLFELSAEEEHLGQALKMISEGAYITKVLINAHPEMDPLSAAFIHLYFASFYQLEKHYLTYPIGKETNNDDLLNMILQGDQDLVNRRAVESYFTQPKETLKPLTLLTCAAQTVAKAYLPIESKTTPVLVQWQPADGSDGGSSALISCLTSGHVASDEVKGLLKRAQQYIVQVYGDPAKGQLAAAMAAYDEQTGLWIAREDAYNQEFGLDLQGSGQLSSQIF